MIGESISNSSPIMREINSTPTTTEFDRNAESQALPQAQVRICIFTRFSVAHMCTLGHMLGLCYLFWVIRLDAIEFPEHWRILV